MDPELFFGSGVEERKASWKLPQLCKQVERAAATTLASEVESEALIGACVVGVEPAPDASRLCVVVLLATDRLEEAREALRAAAGAFRAEAARSIHRKRVPELVFEVRVGGEP